VSKYGGGSFRRDLSQPPKPAVTWRVVGNEINRQVLVNAETDISNNVGSVKFF